MSISKVNNNKKEEKESDTSRDDTFETNWDKVVDSFDSMDLKEDLLRGIYGYGWEKPSGIQQRGILPVIQGNDTIAQAQSGTGKTGTFSIATLQRIDLSNVECQAIILCPVRELAQQTFHVMQSLGVRMKGLTIHLCIGGTSVKHDIIALQQGKQIVVGTPGRINDMIQRGILKLSHLSLFILDEADEMLSRGFKEQIYECFQYLP